MSDDRHSRELIGLLGEADFIRLVEAYGGTRLYVPAIAEGSTLATSQGEPVARKMSARYARDYVRVPLARDLRARHYRAAGLSNSAIARRLGMNETSVDKLFHRMPNKPVKGSGDPRQRDLFSDL